MAIKTHISQGAGDLVVVLPGILGSRLRRADGPVWPFKASLLAQPASIGERLADGLALEPAAFSDPYRPADDDVTVDGLLATRAVIPGFWSIQGYDRLVGWLRDRFDPSGDIIEFPYDWRRSNRVTAQRLKIEIEPLLAARRRDKPDARLILIGHSMGGLAARYYAEVLAASDAVRRVITIGTPFHGAPKVLPALANGKVAFGPVTVEVGDLVRSLPSAAELLPTYRCVGPDEDTLTRLADTRLPGLDPDLVEHALGFHTDMNDAAKARDEPVEYRALLSHLQPTPVWATTSNGLVETRESTSIDWRGDGTVPRVSAVPPGLADADGRAVAGRHAAMQQSDTVYTQLHHLLTSGITIEDMAPGRELIVDAPEVATPGVALTVEVTVTDGVANLLLDLTIDTDAGAVEWPCDPVPGDPGRYRAEVTLADVGVFDWRVDAPAGATPVDPVGDVIVCAG